MPIYIELIALLLATYAAGLGLGWLAWGRAIENEGDTNA